MKICHELSGRVRILKVQMDILHYIWLNIVNNGICIAYWSNKNHVISDSNNYDDSEDSWF